MMDEPFIDYKKKGHKIELIGKEDMEGTEVFKLKLTRKDEIEIYYFIDTEAFIELKTSTTRKMKDGTESNFQSVLPYKIGRIFSNLYYFYGAMYVVRRWPGKED